MLQNIRAVLFFAILFYSLTPKAIAQNDEKNCLKVFSLAPIKNDLSTTSSYELKLQEDKILEVLSSEEYWKQVDQLNFLHPYSQDFLRLQQSNADINNRINESKQKKHHLTQSMWKRTTNKKKLKSLEQSINSEIKTIATIKESLVQLSELHYQYLNLKNKLENQTIRTPNSFIRLSEKGLEQYQEVMFFKHIMPARSLNQVVQLVDTIRSYMSVVEEFVLRVHRLNFSEQAVSLAYLAIKSNSIEFINLTLIKNIINSYNKANTNIDISDPKINFSLFMISYLKDSSLESLQQVRNTYIAFSERYEIDSVDSISLTHAVFKYGRTKEEILALYQGFSGKDNYTGSTKIALMVSLLAATKNTNISEVKEKYKYFFDEAPNEAIKLTYSSLKYEDSSRDLLMTLLKKIKTYQIMETNPNPGMTLLSQLDSGLEQRDLKAIEKSLIHFRETNQLDNIRDYDLTLLTNTIAINLSKKDLITPALIGDLKLNDLVEFSFLHPNIDL